MDRGPALRRIRRRTPLAESSGCRTSVRRAATATAARAARAARVARGVSSTAMVSGNRVRRAGSARASSGSRRAGARANRHVGTGSTERGQHSVLVSNLNRAVESVVVCVDVRLVSLDIGTRWGLVALDGDFTIGGIVVAVLLDVGAIPIDHATCPLDGTFAIRGDTGRPQRHLQTGRGLRELEPVGGCVPGAGFIEGASNFAIDAPVDVVGLPVNLVGVPGVECITINILLCAVVP